MIELMKKRLKGIIAKKPFNHSYLDLLDWLLDLKRLPTMEREDLAIDKEFIELSYKLCVIFHDVVYKPDPQHWKKLIEEMDDFCGCKDSECEENNFSDEGGSGAGDLKNTYPTPEESQHNIDSNKLKR